MAQAFAGTRVRGVYKEFDGCAGKIVTGSEVLGDVVAANALFVLLGDYVQSLAHTRDWVAMEAGAARGQHVWVFEAPQVAGRMDVAIPGVNHYMVFDPTNCRHIRYVSRVIASYDDSHVLPTVVVGAGLGAAVGRGQGAVVGAIGSALLSGLIHDRPAGRDVVCAACHGRYSVHPPEEMARWRCPVCNTVL